MAKGEFKGYLPGAVAGDGCVACGPAACDIAVNSRQNNQGCPAIRGRTALIEKDCGREIDEKNYGREVN